MTAIPDVAAPGDLFDDVTARLPESFWRARPHLDHVRAAAQAAILSPDAVFGAVLARVAALTPHIVELPAVVGAPCGLTFYAALNSRSGGGKSTAAKTAAALVPAPPGFKNDNVPLGSGEGIVEMLFEMVDEPSPTGKGTVKVKRQKHHAAIVHVDEGQVVGELAGRRGSTLLATLRSAWTHSTLGQSNASSETKRIVDGRGYVYGVTIGLQPELAGAILADVAAGTPQRLVWFTADDPGATSQLSDPPGPLCWQPPTTLDLDRHTVTRGGWRRHPLAVDVAVRHEIMERRAAEMRGEILVDPLETHASLARLKVAALLAVLDNRFAVELEDWALAGIVMDASRRVRQSVEWTLRSASEQAERAATERHTRRELHVEQSKEHRALVSASRSVANVVHRHHQRGDHKEQGGGCVRSCLSAAIAGKHRQLVAVDEVIAEAERQAWITPEEDRWTPAESKPA